MRNRIFWSWVIVAGAAGGAHTQWLNQRVPGTPRLRDGKPNLAAPAPRAPNGKPDLSGIWQAEGAPLEELGKLLPGGTNGLGEDVPSKYFLNILSDFKPEEAPIRPAAAQIFQQHASAMGKESPETHCLPLGVPMGELVPAPFKVLQTPGAIALLYEADTSFRQIYTDGRKHPEDMQPAWMGYTVGTWEGDALVVDAVGFNDRSWLDAFGHTHSDALHVTERFHRRDFGHMDLQVTIDDPKTFTRPFTFKTGLRLLPDTDLIESYCAENEKDVTHLGAR